MLPLVLRLRKFPGKHRTLLLLLLVSLLVSLLLLADHDPEIVVKKIKSTSNFNILKKNNYESLFNLKIVHVQMEIAHRS